MAIAAVIKQIAWLSHDRIAAHRWTKTSDGPKAALQEAVRPMPHGAVTAANSRGHACRSKAATSSEECNTMINTSLPPPPQLAPLCGGDTARPGLCSTKGTLARSCKRKMRRFPSKSALPRLRKLTTALCKPKLSPLGELQPLEAEPPNSSLSAKQWMATGPCAIPSGPMPRQLAPAASATELAQKQATAASCPVLPDVLPRSNG
mmetsp:Transcript_20288/g.56348  ORF Transcript_20288/g.56348 Transcript_20288/m.56348 type:complete len:205 (-) Transcript_20288:414-1028(-)